MPLVVQLLLQVAVHRERALAAAATTPTASSTATTTIIQVVPRMLAAARSGCVPRRGPGILFGHRRYVTRYEQYGGRSSRTCSWRRHQDALRAAASGRPSTAGPACHASGGTPAQSAGRGASIAVGANRSRRPNAGTRRRTRRVNGKRYSWKQGHTFMSKLNISTNFKQGKEIYNGDH